MKRFTKSVLAAITMTTAITSYAAGDALTYTNSEFYGKDETDVKELSITSDVGYAPIDDLETGLFYDENSQTLTLVGQINHLEFAKFNMLGWNEMPIERFVVRSGGGMTRIGWAFADFVRKNKITVEIANQCDSACTLIALSSPKLEGHGTLGFHLPYLVPQAGTGSSSENTDDVGYMMAIAGVENDINDAIEFFENSEYISSELLKRIKNETSAEVLIDIDVRQLVAYKHEN